MSSKKNTNSNESKKEHKHKRGEGTVYKRGSDGKYVVQLKINGKRRTIAVCGDKPEAEAILLKTRVEVQENSYIEKDGKTIGAILEENLQNKELSNKVCQSTLLRDRNTANVILNDPISKMPIQKTTRQDIQNFLNNIAQIYSNSYIDKIHTHFSKIFKIATSDHLIRENPFAMGVIQKNRSVKPDRVVDALTREEQAKLVAKLKDPNYKDAYKNIISLLLNTGCRCGEILALERNDIDFKKNVIHINKTLSRDKHDRPILSDSPKTKAGIRDVPMNDEVRRILKNNTNFKQLFTLPDGRYIATSTINTHFKKICKDADIRPYVYEFKRNGKTVRVKSSKVTTHTLRHCYISRMAECRITSEDFANNRRSF